ncbi:MarR family transcriptional regulator [Dyella sp. 2HG41-7]|uniref:MarR family winged helix-turn-helix transcriptional regulator n=1 Tax=Dyella sp. 2HG41-7 TaxID=2883239 RepID=UPI001F27522D|nr:MarR family transcriptional regulator [Dyella sp. 2HG41-7]
MSLNDQIKMLDQGIAGVRKIIPDMPADAGLCRVLLLISETMQSEFEHKLRPHKLNDSEFRTLITLFSRPDGTSTPGELCVFTSLGVTNMTRIADALVKRGLITRGASAEDRRRVVMQITSAGRRFVQKMLPTMFPRLKIIFDGFTDADRRNLNRLLRKLANNLSQLEHEAGDPP